MISSVAGVEKEGRKEEKNQPSLRYLATQILFKGYCIIFLMRFPLPPGFLFNINAILACYVD